MTTRTAIGLTVALAIAAPACRTNTASPTGPTLTYTSAHFTFHHTELDTSSIAASASAVEAEFDRIVSDLGAGTMPRVHVTFHRDSSSMQEAVRPVAGTIPPWATGLVTAADQIHMISFAVGSGRRVSDLVHEFAHAVSLRLNPSFANRPRWLWESVAIYESRQFVDPRAVPYMAALQPPTFAELNSFDNTRVYEVGFTISEFIVSLGGLPALRSLVMNNGDTAATLSLTSAEIERDWFAFARARYGF